MNFTLVGDKLYFRGDLVAILAPELSPVIRQKFVEALVDPKSSERNWTRAENERLRAELRKVSGRDTYV